MIVVTLNLPLNVLPHTPATRRSRSGRYNRYTTTQFAR